MRLCIRMHKGIITYLECRLVISQTELCSRKTNMLLVGVVLELILKRNLVILRRTLNQVKVVKVKGSTTVHLCTPQAR